MNMPVAALSAVIVLYALNAPKPKAAWLERSSVITTRKRLMPLVNNPIARRPNEIAYAVVG